MSDNVFKQVLWYRFITTYRTKIWQVVNKEHIRGILKSTYTQYGNTSEYIVNPAYLLTNSVHGGLSAS